MSEIQINGSYLGQRITGQQRYANEIAAAMRRLAPELVTVQPGVQHVLTNKYWAWAWSQTALPVRSFGHTLVSLTSRSAVAHSRQIVTIHDLFPLEHPEWYTSSYATLHSLLLRTVAKRAKGIIAVSQPVADAVVSRRLCARETPIVVAPNAPSDLGVAEDVGEGRKVPERLRALTTSRRYFLSVGSVSDPRKNLGRLLSSYLRLPTKLRREIPLVVVGGGNSAVFNGAELPRGEGIQMLGYVSDADLTHLYGPQAILVSASLDEGFGLPLVEAHRAGAQLLVSDISVYRWVCGEAATYFDPLREETIADALMASAKDAPTRAGKMPRTYDWNLSARRVLDLARAVS